MKLFLSTADVATLTGLTVETVQVLARQGELPGRKVGKMWFFHRETLMQFLSTPMPTPPSREEVAGGNGAVLPHQP